jgi:hypothetical protein
MVEATAYVSASVRGSPSPLPRGESVSEGAVTLGSNLADYTGGGYNQDLQGLMRLTSSARKDCSCLYRIGLLHREGYKGRVYRTSVSVRGKELPYRWRMRTTDETPVLGRRLSVLTTRTVDRRRALGGAVPNNSKGPFRPAGVDVAALESVQTADEEAHGRPVSFVKEVDPKKEMLTLASLHGRGGAPPRDPCESVPGLGRGSYRLVAFVRDKTANFRRGPSRDRELPPEASRESQAPSCSGEAISCRPAREEGAQVSGGAGLREGMVPDGRPRPTAERRSMR